MLTHVDKQNNPTMVDVSAKQVTARQATAVTSIYLPPEVLAVINDGEISTKKGPVLATARIAGTMAVKKTAELIPFCHPLPIDAIKFAMEFKADELEIRCQVKTRYKTGVEMEALTGAQIAALTVYDMCKAISQQMVIRQGFLLEKSGGKKDYVAD